MDNENDFTAMLREKDHQIALLESSKENIRLQHTLELMAKDNEKQKELHEKELKIQQLTARVQLLEKDHQKSVGELMLENILKRKNIEQNQIMRETIGSVQDLVVAPIDIEAKQEIVVVFENNEGKLQVFRGQRQSYDLLMANMKKPLKRSGARNSWYDKDKSWDQVGEPIACANAKKLWLYARSKNLKMMFGLKFDSRNRSKTTFCALEEDELREKYRLYVKMLESASGSLDRNVELSEFKKFNFSNEDECVAQCLTRSAEDLLQFLENTSREILPTAPEEVNAEEVGREFEKLYNCYTMTQNNHLTLNQINIVNNLQKI